VLKGELADVIGRQFRVSVKNMRLNRLGTEMPMPGQKLKIYQEKIGKGKD
jgi:hypothetical protein